MTLLSGQIVNFWWLDFRRSPTTHFEIWNFFTHSQTRTEVWLWKFEILSLVSKEASSGKFTVLYLYWKYLRVYAVWKSRETIGNRILIMYDFQLFPVIPVLHCTLYIYYIHIPQYKQDFFFSYRQWSEIGRKGLGRGIPSSEEFKRQKQKCVYYFLSCGRGNSSSFCQIMGGIVFMRLQTRDWSV